jgi:FlaA1/EpsC-like NDP-sugar epimerase
MIEKIFQLQRIYKQALIGLFDIFVVVGSIFLAYYIRLGYFFFPAFNNTLSWIIILSPLMAIPIFIRFGLYHEVIRYFGNSSLWRIVKSSTAYALLWGLSSFMVNVEFLPRSVIIINWLLVIILITSSRFLARWLLNDLKKGKNVLIYGAGSAGRQLSNALIQSNEYNPIAFIDDASDIYKNSINGLKVYSKLDLKNLIAEKKIKEVLIAIPSIQRSNRNKIINSLEPFPVVVRALPGVSELAQGKVKVNDLYDIDLNDLLGRESVKPNMNLLETNILDKVVLVTGAGGSIGSELSRQIVFLKPKKIILYEISESALYVIEQELINIGIPNLKVIPILGSVEDRVRMELICNSHGVSTIYHAAAYKHVPLVEFNPTQGVINNTIGTLQTAKAAIASKVKTFVLISTDKAVRPTNVMGATKRAAELVLQSLDKEQNNTCFTMVRFGNVMNSSGSVIPLFKKQIKEGGPLTVTHPDVVRYFMSIPEAVELVIQAGAMGKGGDVFVLDMGEPIRIHDLAVKMIQLSGLSVRDDSNSQGDIEISYTGLRPGEKLYEELLVGEKSTITDNPLIMRAKEEMINWQKLESMLFELDQLARGASLKENSDKVIELLTQIVPQFTPQPTSEN